MNSKPLAFTLSALRPLYRRRVVQALYPWVKDIYFCRMHSRETFRKRLKGWLGLQESPLYSGTSEWVPQMLSGDSACVFLECQQLPRFCDLMLQFFGQGIPKRLLIVLMGPFEGMERIEPLIRMLREEFGWSVELAAGHPSVGFIGMTRGGRPPFYTEGDLSEVVNGLEMSPALFGILGEKP